MSTSGLLFVETLKQEKGESRQTVAHMQAKGAGIQLPTPELRATDA